jgi:hypothetical protein
MPPLFSYVNYFVTAAEYWYTEYFLMKVIFESMQDVSFCRLFHTLVFSLPFYGHLSFQLTGPTIKIVLAISAGIFSAAEIPSCLKPWLEPCSTWPWRSIAGFSWAHLLGIQKRAVFSMWVHHRRVAQQHAMVDPSHRWLNMSSWMTQEMHLTGLSCE